MTLLTIFCSLLVIQGILSVASGQAFLKFIRKPRPAPPDYHPHATILLPCRGNDPSLKQHLEALVRQQYPSFELLCVVDDERDAAVPAIEEVIRQAPCRARLIVAGHAVDCGQKVHNLLVACDRLSMETEVLVFADADALMHQEWLAHLVAPLGAGDALIGATTGFRWYLAQDGKFLSSLLSAWNGTAVTALGDHGKNFCWGGSTAINRELFERLGVAQAWQGTLSDDYVLAQVVRDSGRTIRFVPECLVVSRETAGIRQLLSFTTRQMTITRVYNPRLWNIGLASNAAFLLALLASFVWGVRDLFAAGQFTLLGFCAALYLLAAWKGVLRIRAAVELLAGYRREILGNWPMFVLGVPLVALLYVYNTIRAGFSNKIRWKGITYRVISPSKIEILEREEPTTDEQF